MTKKSLLIVGFGGHFHSCLEIIEDSSEFKISGIIGDPKEVGKEYGGYQVIGCDEDLVSLRKYNEYAFLCIGQIRSSQKRTTLFKKLLDLKYSIPSFIAPSAYVSPRSLIGDGVIVMNNATINSGATIGKNCIINTGAIVEHDVKIGDYCHISTGVIINGNAEIESHSFIGSGSIVREGARVRSESFVPMGSSVTKDLI